MSDPEIEISQHLAERYWAACQGRFVCCECNDGRHRRCLGFDCNCLHRDSIPKPPIKSKNNQPTHQGENEMKLYPKERELVSEGDHLLRLTRIVDLGEQKNDWDEVKHYIRPCLVVLDEKDSEDNFKTINDRWNISFSPGARLYKAILAFTGKQPDQGFETNDLLGLKAIATVKWNTTDKGTWDNITDYKPAAGNNGDGTPTPAADNAVPPVKTEDVSMSGAITKAKKKARVGETAETELKITDEDIPF